MAVKWKGLPKNKIKAADVECFYKIV